MFNLEKKEILLVDGGGEGSGYYQNTSQYQTHYQSEGGSQGQTGSVANQGIGYCGNIGPAGQL